jgi:hypothetical protein
LNYELQFDFKKGKNLGNCAIFLNLIFLHPLALLLTKANRGALPYKSTPEEMALTGPLGRTV